MIELEGVDASNVIWSEGQNGLTLHYGQADEILFRDRHGQCRTGDSVLSRHLRCKPHRLPLCRCLRWRVLCCCHSLRQLMTPFPVNCENTCQKWGF